MIYFIFFFYFHKTRVAGSEHLCDVCDLFESYWGYSDTLWQFYYILQNDWKVKIYNLLKPVIISEELLWCFQKAFTYKILKTSKMSGFPFTLRK